MATLTQNAQRIFGGGGRLNNVDVIASDIIYEHAAVGMVAATGLARPLVAGDLFLGFADEQVDNSAGAASAKDVQLIRKGVVTLTVDGVVITDLQQPVYASDDATFTMHPAEAAVPNTFIGFVTRWKSSGVAEVAFDIDQDVNPWAGYVVEMVAANKTLDAQDSGKALFVDTDATTTTLPATAVALDCVIVNAGGYGTVLVAVSPAAADKVQGPDAAGTDNKDHLNTKATAQRGDYIKIRNGHADGAIVKQERGIWATEA